MKKFIGVIALIVVIALGYYLYSNQSALSLNDVHIPELQVSSWKFIGNATSGPATEIYEGTAVVSGEYLFDPGYGYEWMSFFPNDTSVSKIPADVNFDIENKDILKLFNLPADTCYARGNAEIEIGGFDLLKAEIGALSSSRLMRVLSSSNNEIRTISKYGPDCE